MKIKSLLFTAVLATAFLCSANAVKASCIDENFSQRTNAEQIQCLTGIIAQLQAQIQAILAQQGSTTWCHTFNSNLGFANSGNVEVSQLHTALQKENISYGSDSSTIYSTGTVSAVAQFQKKYLISPLSGYVGSLTRAKLNSLYGCGTTPIAVPTQLIQLFMQEHNVSSDQIRVTITTQDDTHIRGGVSVSPFGIGDGGYFLAAKVNGAWQIVFEGNGAISCSLIAQYNFPASMSSDCYSSSQPSITITSPNGGETFIANSPTVVSFTSANVPAGTHYSIGIVGVNNVETSLVGGSIIYNSDQTASVIILAIAPTFPVGNYKIRISATVNGAIVQDISNNYFYVTVIPPCTYSYGTYGTCINGTQTRTYSTTPTDSECAGTPVVSQPCDADKYCKPATTAIFSWASSCGSKLTQIAQAGVTLATGETIDLITITRYVTDVTKWDAHVVTCPTGTTYRVCVENGNDGLGNYVLLGVKAVATVQPSITVTSPNGGETFTAGSNITITWSNTNYRNSLVNIYLYKSNTIPGNSGYTFVAQVGSLTQPNDGTETWTIPSTIISGNNYFIRLGLDVQDPQTGMDTNDDSDAPFSIVAPTTATNGACGSTNGLNLATIPSTNLLCLAGTASSVSGSGPWTWTCGGSNGGTIATCSANISENSVSWTLAYSSGGAACAKINRSCTIAYTTSNPTVACSTQLQTGRATCATTVDGLGKNWATASTGNATCATEGRTCISAYGFSGSALSCSMTYSSGTAFCSVTTVALTPAITVTSPNGGDTLIANSPTDVLFTSANVPAGTHYNVGIVGVNNVETPLTGGSIVYNSAQTASVTIPPIATAFPIGNYKIRISVTVNGAIVQDISNNYFYITVLPACTYSYGLYGECTNGTQTRTYSTTPTDSECAGTPITSQSCAADKYCEPASTAIFNTWSSGCGSKLTQIAQAGVTLATGETVDLIRITKYVTDITKWDAHTVTCPTGTTYRVCVENGNDGSGNYVLLGVKAATTGFNNSQNNLAAISDAIVRIAAVIQAMLGK